MTSNVQHTDVGAYALGLLESADRRAFETHLATCSSCQAELNEFSEMAQLLGDVRTNQPASEPAGPPDSAVPPSAVPPDSGEPPAPVADLLRRKAKADRSHRLNRAVLGIAAGIVLLAGGTTVGAAVVGFGGTTQHQVSGPAEQLLMTGQRFSATDPGTKAAGVVALEPKGWGTHVALELKNVRGPLECQMVMVSKSGERRVITGWAVPPKGYGVPGSPDPLLVHGGTSFKRDQIARFDVVIVGGERDGQNLVSIPA